MLTRTGVPKMRKRRSNEVSSGSRNIERLSVRPLAAWRCGKPLNRERRTVTDLIVDTDPHGGKSNHEIASPSAGPPLTIAAIRLGDGFMTTTLNQRIAVYPGTFDPIHRGHL